LLGDHQCIDHRSSAELDSEAVLSVAFALLQRRITGSARSLWR
jgi:hypothetical protein